MERSRLAPALLVIALLLACLAPLPAQPVSAQDDSGSRPRATAEPLPWQDDNGYRHVPASAAADGEDLSAAQPSATSGGPDEYGYTWLESPGLNWIDATGGIDTGMSGDSYGVRHGPVVLPFSFPYYAGSYDRLYIAASGYVGFLDGQRWPAQVETPYAAAPNAVIAPYSTPLTLAQSGRSGRVFYLAGGTAPNRYFVVQWNDVWFEDGDERYTFEVILYENGDILFQYKSMSYNPYTGWICGYAGIEDADGVTGLRYKQGCEWAGSNMTVRFARPLPSARVAAGPLTQGGFARPAETAEYAVTVTNNGNVGADTYDVVLTSAWQAQVLRADGRPLPDSDGNQTPDTGPLGVGQSTKLLVRVKAPSFGAINDHNAATLSVRSTLNAAAERTLTLRTVIPQPFVQVYDDLATPGVHAKLFGPGGARNTQLPSPGSYSELAIAALPGGGHIVVWDEKAGDYIWVLRYAILGSQGELLGGVRTILGADGAPLPDYPVRTGLAVLPNGRIGIAWTQLAWLKGDTWVPKYNTYFAIVDRNGAVVAPPVDLTGNVDFGGARIGGTHIATADGNFVIAWTEGVYTSDGYVSNVFYSIRGPNNEAVKPRTQFSTSTATGLNEAYTPVLGGTTSGGLVLALLNSGDPDRVLATRVGSNGEILAGPFVVAEELGEPSAMVQLSTGKMVLAWNKYEFDSLPALRYALLDPASLRVVAGPATLQNTGSLTGDGPASLLADANGHAVFSWGENAWDFLPYQIYSVIDSSGAAVVPPTKFLYARGMVDGMIRLRSSDNGFGIAADLAFAPVSTTQPDVAVTMPSLISAAPQGRAQVVIDVANWGLPTAGDVVVTAELDPRLTFKGAVPQPSTTEVAVGDPDAAPKKVVWNAPDLAYLSGGRIVLSTGVPSATIGSQYPVTVTVTLSGADFKPKNNTATTEVMVSDLLYTPLVSKGQE